MPNNLLQHVHSRYSEAILEVACMRFGFTRSLLTNLEGSSFVYEGLLDGRSAILKVTPGLLSSKQRILGASIEQVLGEIDFVLYLHTHGVPVALPIPSRAGNLVESIPLDGKACFLAYAFEKISGIMYPDEPIVNFPESVLVEWGRLLGWIHRLSGEYQPSYPACPRPGWEADDLLDYRSLIPSDQPRVWQRYEEALSFLNNLPRNPQVFGLIHGDFHHGNFFVVNNHLVAFDFDAAHYSWYIADIVIALYNCLPMPRSQTLMRREYSTRFLTYFLRGYTLEKPVNPEWVAGFPFFLKLNELLDYSHHYKYWDMDDLSERRRSILTEMRWRIENEAPVVQFQSEDLGKLISRV
jgi:Ser/Thr protein kinase RdoA (MazF antagonist)